MILYIYHIILLSVAIIGVSDWAWLQRMASKEDIDMHAGRYALSSIYM